MNWMIVAVILVRTFGDVSFKKAMSDVNFDSVSSVSYNLKILFSNIYWWLGLFFGVLNIIFWIFSLQVMELSQAYLFLSMSYVAIILAGKLYLKNFWIERKK